MNSKLNLVKRAILFFLGMSIIQFGVALYIKTNIGSDPFTVFTQGLAFLLNITPGKANMIILVSLFSIILFIGRKRINIGTFICVMGVGPIIDLSMKTVSLLSIDSFNIILKVLVVAAGCIIIAIGFSIVSASNLGVAPNDIIPFIIQDKTNFQYRWIRIGLDIGYLTIGYFLGGIVGVGTIIALLLLGPCIQFCLPYGEQFVRMVTNNKEITKDELIA